jgi:branched-chain amino acid transport system substrate-binding protein
MLKIKTLFFTLTFFSSLSVLAQPPTENRDEINIGALMAISGPYSMQIAAFKEGLELAAEQINSSGGINGKSIRLKIEDTANSSMTSVTAAKKLIEFDGIIAAFSTTFPEVSTGVLEFQKNKIPTIHLWDSSPEIELLGEYIFGVGPWTPSSGEVSASFASRELQAKSAAIFYTNDPWSKLVAQYFEEEFKNAGGKVIKSFSFNPQDSDFRAALVKTKSLAPEVVYSPISDNILPFYSQLKQANLKAKIISSDVIGEEHIKANPKAFEGIYMSNTKDLENVEMRAFSKLYEQKFKKQLAISWMTAIAYDGLSLIAQCIKKTGELPENINTCIAETRNFPGASRIISFNKGGSSPQPVSIFRIEKQKFKLIR